MSTGGSPIAAKDDNSGQQGLTEYLEDWQSRLDRSQLMSFLGPGILEILDSLPYYVLLVDRHHRILLANKATRQTLGVEPEEITGELCPQAVHALPKGEAYAGCPLEEAVEKQQPVENIHFDEQHGLWLRIAMYPTNAWTVSGERIYLHMIQNITEQKQIEAELERLQEENKRLVEELGKSSS